MTQPSLGPLDAGLIVADAPIVVGLAALGLLASLRVWLPGVFVTPEAESEMATMIEAGVPDAAAVARSEYPVALNAVPAAATPALHDEGYRFLDALARMCAPAGSAVEGRSAASVVVAAHYHNVPALAHRACIPYIAYNAGRSQARFSAVGVADLCLWLARERLPPEDAWELYRQAAGTVAGQQRGWPLSPSGADEFRFWAGEAAAGRI